MFVKCRELRKEIGVIVRYSESRNQLISREYCILKSLDRRTNESREVDKFQDERMRL